MQQQELKFKSPKVHNISPITALQHLLEIHTKPFLGELLGVSPQAMYKWLREGRMPAGLGLLCEKLLAEARAEAPAPLHLFLVSVPNEHLASLQTILLSLNLPHQKLSI